MNRKLAKVVTIVTVSMVITLIGCSDNHGVNSDYGSTSENSSEPSEPSLAEKSTGKDNSDTQEKIS